MEHVLAKFEEVFKEPRDLPPAHSMVHKIPLKEGVDPVNVRPYKYPHLMKEEIENQVVQMLKTGIIRPSTSLIPIQ